MRTKWVKVLIIGKGYVVTYLYNKLKEVESVRVECVQSSEFDYTDPSLIEKKLSDQLLERSKQFNSYYN